VSGSARRGVVLALIGCLVIGAVAGAFLMGWLHPTADTAPISNATKTVLVTAPVEQQPSRQAYTLNAQVTVPTTVDVVSNARGGSGSDDEDGGTAVQRPVVSAQTHVVGDVIRYGDLVAEVSGDPVFAVSESLPLYRDVTLNTKGNDVLGVQQMLTDLGLYSGQVVGEAGPLTVKAIAAFYKRAGYTAPQYAPNQAMLRLADTAAIPANGLIVASVSPLGTEVDGDHPLMTVEVSPAVITARVDMVQASVFTVGTTVEVRVGSTQSFDAAVTAVSEFREPERSLPGGYDITVAVPDEMDASAIGTSPIVLKEKTDVPMGTAVPLMSIRRDATGQTYVIIAPAEQNGSTPGMLTQVPVTVASQVAGYAIIDDNPRLSTGVRVVVSGD